MGFFDLFKKKKVVEPETRTINLEKIPDLINKYQNTKLDHINTSITTHKKTIQETISQLQTLIKGLRTETLRNKNIPFQHVNIMEGNRINYTKQYEQFLQEIELSEDIEQLPKDIEAVRAAITRLGTATQRGQQILKEFFSVTIQRINKATFDMTHALEQVDKLLNNKQLSIIKQINKELEELKHHKKGREEKQKQHQELQTQINQLKEREKKLLKQIDEVKSSNEYTTYQELKEKLQQKTDSYNKAVEQFLTNFSTIHKALIKYKRNSLLEEVIDQYINNTLGTLSTDNQLKEILTKLQTAVEKEEVSLDSRKKTKTLEAIQTLIPMIGTIRKHVANYETETKELHTRLKRDTATLSLEQFKNYLQQNILRIQALEEKQKKLARNNTVPSERINNIQEKLKELTGQDMRIVYDATYTS